MENYKGFYYKESKSKKYFEGGAHFRYKDLFKILLSLGGTILEENIYYSNIHQNNENKSKNKKLTLLSNKEKCKKNLPKTRNINNINYINNPNTKETIKTKKIHQINLSNNNLENLNSINKIKAKKKYEEKSNINNFYYNNVYNIICPQTQRYHINNNLVKELLNNKNNIIEDKNPNNNTINNNKKNYSYLLNYLKSKIHMKNKSETFIQNINEKNNQGNLVIRKKNISHLKQNLNKKSLNIKVNHINTNINNNDNKNININKNNCLMIYEKSKTKLSRSHLNTDINKIIKTNKNSRNIINKNKGICTKSFENIKSRNNRDNKISIKIRINLEGLNTLTSVNYLDNKTLNNNYSYDNNLALTNNNSRDKTVNLTKGKKIFGIQKYIKKKINHYCVFNKNKLDKKSGKKIISRNLLNSGNEPIFNKYKTSSDINQI